MLHEEKDTCSIAARGSKQARELSFSPILSAGMSRELIQTAH